VELGHDGGLDLGVTRTPSGERGEAERWQFPQAVSHGRGA
jgi:hypothetical protein